MTLFLTLFSSKSYQIAIAFWRSVFDCIPQTPHVDTPLELSIA